METRRRFDARLIAAAFLGLAGCASTPVIPPVTTPDPQAIFLPPDGGAFGGDYLTSLPGWPGLTGAGALAAMQASCDNWMRRGDGEPVSRRVGYAGSVGEWRPLCEGLARARNAGEAELVLRGDLVPLEVVPDERNRFTGYFEPEIEARRQPVPPFTEPVPGIPSDLVTSGGGPAQRRLADGRLVPYPAREAVDVRALPALGYAHPADVFFLQIQGSGRLKFPDGEVVRAAFAAHNGQPFRGIANWLISEGEITRGEAGMTGIRAWMDRSDPARVRQAMNINPRYVFFVRETITDPAEGPKGAMGIPLTPWGSIAVDTDLHPLGIPVYVETTLGGRGVIQGVFIAQDTGGAIKGPVRGDIYYGTGAEAGRTASGQNAPGRMWVLVPRSVAARLRAEDMARASAGM